MTSAVAEIDLFYRTLEKVRPRFIALQGDMISIMPHARKPDAGKGKLTTLQQQ